MRYRGNTQGNRFGSCTEQITLKIYAVLKGASAGGITGCEFLGSVGPTVYANSAPFMHESAADPGWLFIELPNPTATVRLGNAFRPDDTGDTSQAPRGLQQSWDTCQTGSDGKVLIEEVVLGRTAVCGPGQTPATLQLSTGGHDSPSNQFFRCPLFTLCDAPAFTKVCLGDDIHTCNSPVPPFANLSSCSTSGLFTINPAPDPGTGHVKDYGDCAKSSKGGATAADHATWSEMKSVYR
jgi:hypothetical protein